MRLGAWLLPFSVLELFGAIYTNDSTTYVITYLEGVAFVSGGWSSHPSALHLGLALGLEWPPLWPTPRTGPGIIRAFPYSCLAKIVSYKGLGTLLNFGMSSNNKVENGMASRVPLCFVTKTGNYLAPVLVWTKRVDLIFRPTYLSSNIYSLLEMFMPLNVFLYRVLV
jgi:hypothetical protein